MISSFPNYHQKDSLTLDILEYIIISIFSLEYLLKIFTAPVWYKWAIRPMNVLDLLAILPFFIELALADAGVSGLAVVRVIRLLRIIRLFKFNKYSSTLQLIVRTLAISKDGLFMLLVLVAMGMVFFSSLVFYAEQFGATFDDETETWYRSDGLESPFQSIPHAFWWCVVTMTTVGYGDQYPITPLGKLVGCFTMLTGVLILAFPISVIGQNFQMVWTLEKETRRKKKEKKKQKRTNRYRKISLHSAVNSVDQTLYDLNNLMQQQSSTIAEATQKFEDANRYMEVMRSHIEKSLQDNAANAIAESNDATVKYEFQKDEV